MRNGAPGVPSLADIAFKETGCSESRDDVCHANESHRANNAKSHSIARKLLKDA